MTLCVWLVLVLSVGLSSGCVGRGGDPAGDPGGHSHGNGGGEPYDPAGHSHGDDGDDDWSPEEPMDDDTGLEPDGFLPEGDVEIEPVEPPFEPDPEPFEPEPFEPEPTEPPPMQVAPNGFNKCQYDEHNDDLGGRHQKTLKNGKKLHVARVDTLKACCDVCFEVPECGAINLDRINGICYLKGKDAEIPEQETPSNRVTNRRPIEMEVLPNLNLNRLFVVDVHGNKDGFRSNHIHEPLFY